jgi:hypothetical protein
MSSFDYILWGLVVVAAVFVGHRIVVAARAYWRYRGERLITCPEISQTEAVEVNAKKAALDAFRGVEHLRLRDCSRWPERAGCGEDCLSQVEADPQSCLVWNIVHNWYEDKVCALCQKPFGSINWHDHRPALLDAEGNTVQWTAIPPETLREVFLTHEPVCWNCHVAESFRREHPELVTDRPQH